MSKPRPKTLTHEMALRAAEKIVSELALDGLVDAGEDRRALAAQVAKHGGIHTDGFELAKRLDRYCYWSCDFRTAEILDRFALYAADEINEAVAAWAKREKPVPPFGVGTHVKSPSGVGVIAGISEYGHAQFLVAEDGDERPDRRLVVNFEDAEPLP